MAETGVRDLFKGILHLVLEHDNKLKVFRLRNSFVPINPARNGNRSSTPSWVGLALQTTKIAFLTQVAAKQEQNLMQLGPQNPIVSMEQEYAA